MKATKYQLADFRLHPILNHRSLTGYSTVPLGRLLSCECKMMDGDLVEDGETPFKNNKNTLVMALPTFGDASNKENLNIWDWVDSMIDDCMTAVAELKPDEFEIAPLEGVDGYDRIARFYWH